MAVSPSFQSTVRAAVSMFRGTRSARLIRGLPAFFTMLFLLSRILVVAGPRLARTDVHQRE